MEPYQAAEAELREGRPWAVGLLDLTTEAKRRVVGAAVALSLGGLIPSLQVLLPEPEQRPKGHLGPG